MDIKTSSTVALGIFEALGPLGGASAIYDLAGHEVSLPSLGSLDTDIAQIQDDFSVIGNDFQGLLKHPT